MAEDFLGHQKFLVFRPPVVFLRQTNFIFAQGFAVRPMRILFVGRAERNVTIDDNETRGLGFVFERFQRLRQRVQVIRVRDV